jgi:hypothetical protein
MGDYAESRCSLSSVRQFNYQLTREWPAWFSQRAGNSNDDEAFCRVVTGRGRKLLKLVLIHSIESIAKVTLKTLFGAATKAAYLPCAVRARISSGVVNRQWVPARRPAGRRKISFSIVLGMTSTAF